MTLSPNTQPVEEGIFPWSNSIEQLEWDNPKATPPGMPLPGSSQSKLSWTARHLQARLLHAVEQNHPTTTRRDRLRIAMVKSDSADQLERRVESTSDARVRELVDLRTQAVALAPHTRQFWEKLAFALCFASQGKAVVSGQRVTLQDCIELSQREFKPCYPRPGNRGQQNSPANTPARVVVGFTPKAPKAVQPSPNQPLRRLQR